ncbi:DUF222 domain-containing protein [Agromyces agglutinans]|nr:DUF222 domain-containing protein [Agromyces agglutinans]
MSATLLAPPEAALEWELMSIAAFDGMIRQIQADQYRRVQRARELAAEVERVTESSTSRERDMATRSFVAELATTLGQHEVAAARLVAEAERLTGPRAATLDALGAGDLGLTQVRSVLELTRDLPADVADQVEAVAVAAAAAAVADGTASTNADLRRRMRRARERMHPEPLADRRARAAEDRRVCVDAAPDGMAWLSVFLEAERAVAIEHRLELLAGRAPAGDGDVGDDDGHGDGDTRIRTQRAADLAADLLLAGTLSDDERTRADIATPPAPCSLGST